MAGCSGKILAIVTANTSDFSQRLIATADEVRSLAELRKLLPPDAPTQG
jgi:hypothetical protein